MVNRDSKGRPGRYVLGLMVLALSIAGCSNRDAEIDKALNAKAKREATHVHYPVLIRADFGEANPVSGVDVDVFGSYSHVTLRSREHANGLSEVATESMLSDTLRKAIAAAAETERKTPAPGQALRTGPDWTSAPHPPAGTYEADLTIGRDKEKIVIKPSADPAQTSSDLRKQLNAVIRRYRLLQEQSLKAGEIPPAFAVRADGYLPAKFDPKKRNDPVLRGLPLLVAPVDKALVIRDLRTSLDKICTALRKSGVPKTEFVILGPTQDHQFSVSVGSGSSDSSIQAALGQISAEIDALNAKAR